ncbi:hypothetical protein LEP1GSC192_0384 [Leptospira sp. B5-022]|nr:hypothetical protein LEP1GSC192_0384 [Leptospira sp. B5-022]
MVHAHGVHGIFGTSKSGDVELFIQPKPYSPNSLMINCVLS